MLPIDAPTRAAAAREPSTALVLAGGAALGAYEAGAIRYVLEELGPALGKQPRFNMYGGTSIGALNASILASRSQDPLEASRALTEYWRSLTFSGVLRFSGRELGSLARLLLGHIGRRGYRLAQLSRPATAPHRPVAGLFDTSRLQLQMRDMISREALRRAFADGSLRGIALCATEVCTGRGVIFYETADGVELKPSRDPVVAARQVELGVQHAMASSALPFIFPSVQVDGVCYTDGALRQNTPLGPILRMGADRVLVISVTQEPQVAARSARLGCRRNPYPGALFLLGKTINVLLAQSLDHELNRLEMVNRLIEDGMEIYGPGFLQNLGRVATAHRNAPYRLVRTCHIRPSRDLHRMALEALRDAPRELSMPGLGGRLLTWLLASASVAEAELLSYVLFTPTYVGRLLELGYRDAQAQRDELLRFFADERLDEQMAS